MLFVSSGLKHPTRYPCVCNEVGRSGAKNPNRLGLAVVMKWLQLSNARNMLMTVNIKLSIIVIAEIIPSTDDTCLHQSISPQNGPSKVTNSCC